jgi:hypothetical protein
MWLQLLMAPAYDTTVYVPPSGDPTPQFTGTTSVHSTSAGFCSGGPGSGVTSSAAIQLVWNITPLYSTSYFARVYENNILVLDNSTAFTFNKTMTGLVENSGGNPANLIYRIDIVRRSDGVVVASSTAPQWTKQYAGHC